MEERKKTQVADMDRGVYDIKNNFEYSYIADAGLTEEIIREIWANKNEPEWMLDFRLKSLEIYNRMEIPNWIPDISGLDMENIYTYVKPKVDMKENWDEVPEDIKSTFDRLGIPEAEKTSLAGVGAQYDSEVVYHSIQEDLVKQGVIYTDIETALHEHEEIVKKYWMTLIPPTDHKWAALHGAVWSGGSFVYVPAGVQVDIPLQSYFRLNAPGAGQFEHTMIIVEEGAKVHFIEGCSAPKYDVSNLHAGAVELFVKVNLCTFFYNDHSVFEHTMIIVEEGAKVHFNEQFNCACMKIRYIIFRSRTTFDKVNLCTFFYNDHSVFELASTWCIQTEIGLQRNIHLYTCRNIYKGTTRPYGAMKSSPFMICRWNQCHPIFFYNFFMLMKSCFDICINNTLFYKVFLYTVIYNFRVVLSAYTSKRCFLCFRNTKTIKSTLNILRNFVPIFFHIYFWLNIGINIFHI